MRAAVENEDWRALHPSLQVTISIGQAHQPDAEPLAPGQEMLALADRRLCAAKQDGRNCVVDVGSEPRDGDAPRRGAA